MAEVGNGDGWGELMWAVEQESTAHVSRLRLIMGCGALSDKQLMEWKQQS